MRPVRRVDEPPRQRSRCPDRRCRKLSAVRSAVSIAAAAPRTSATTAPARSGPRRGTERELHAGIELAERLGGDVEARNHAAALGEDARRARADRQSTVASVVTSPQPEILGERAAHELAIERRVERLEGTTSFCSSGASGAAKVHVDLQRLGNERVDPLDEPAARRSRSTSGSSAS